jgi:hypothetical protein
MKIMRRKQEDRKGNENDMSYDNGLLCTTIYHSPHRDLF